MTAEQRQLYTDLLRSRLSDQRFEHSLNVARQAIHLAQVYGADEAKAELAGLLHDIMKEADDSEQLRYVKMLEPSPPPELMTVPKLWHAVAGAAFLRAELGITDPDVISAVRYHTSGRTGMSLLERIIYLADYTSAERRYNGADEMRHTVEYDLDKAMLIALSFTLESHARKGALIYPDTFFAYNELAARTATAH